MKGTKNMSKKRRLKNAKEKRMDEENLAKVEKFTLHCGHESNEAGIAELRDADGMNVEPDGRRWKNHG